MTKTDELVGTVDYNRIVSATYEAVIGHNSLVDTWGPICFGRRYDDHHSLRNKIFVIWFNAFIDTAEASQRYLPELVARAKAIGAENLVLNIGVIDGFCKLAIDVLEQYSREEQIFLCDIRNQIVHGYFSNRHREKITVKFSQYGQVVKERLGIEEYNAARFAIPTLNLDDQIVHLMPRFFEGIPDFWKALSQLRSNKLYGEMSEGLLIKPLGENWRNL